MRRIRAIGAGGNIAGAHGLRASGTRRSTPSSAATARRTGLTSFMSAGLDNAEHDQAARHQPVLASGAQPRMGSAQPDGRHLGHGGGRLRRSAGHVGSGQHAPLHRPRRRCAVPVPARSALGHGAARLHAQSPSLPRCTGQPAGGIRRRDRQRAAQHECRGHQSRPARQGDLRLPGQVRRQPWRSSI